MANEGRVEWDTPFDSPTTAADAGARCAREKLHELGAKPEYCICLVGTDDIAGLGSAGIDATSEHDALVHVVAALADHLTVVARAVGMSQAQFMAFMRDTMHRA